MADTDPPSAETLNEASDPLARVAQSAQGWHRIQLAVLGFIGFCGLFWDGGTVAGRTGIQVFLMLLVVLAFALAVVAIFVVARVAHPVHDPGEPTGADREPTVASKTRLLRIGIRMTYIAVMLVVAATLSAWLPVSADDGAVVVADAAGQTWCGQLLEAPAGEARLATAEGPVAISLDRVVLLRPVGDC